MEGAMKGADDLLELVEQGNAVGILSEQNLVKRFNYLLKYDLVKIDRDKVCLTEKGKQAKKEGLRAVVEREKQRRRIRKLQRKKNERSKKVSYLLLAGAIILFIMLIFYLIFT